MSDKLEIDQVLAIMAKSYFLAEVIGKHAHKRWENEMPGVDSTPLSGLVEKIQDLEDSICDIKSDKFLSFRIVSDDDGKSESGPWHVDVYGACGVWLVSTNDYDRLWFADRESAISAAYDYAHASIIEVIDRGVSEFQQTNSDADQVRKARDYPPLPTRLQSDPSKRLFGFYLGNGSNQTFYHNKYGADGKSDMAGLISAAFNASEIEVASALTRAKELKWEEAARALDVVLDAKKRVASLEHEIERLKMGRTLEIEVDDWRRRNGISEPQMEDFVRMAAARKPFFRYRELARTWDLNQPSAYRDAYDRVVTEREKLEAERSRPDED